MKQQTTLGIEENRITVGLATCGQSAGAKNVYDALVLELKAAGVTLPLQKTGCIGMCHNEPIVTVIQNNKTAVYGNVLPEDIPELVQAIKEKKKYTKRFLTYDINSLPFYKKQHRFVLENCGVVDPARLDHFLAKGGFSGLKKVLEITPQAVIDTVEKANLRGRGGAGFPTAKKWRFIADAKGPKYIVCNGDEGDPGAFMNRTLMESDPFRIIEGLVIGAYATGAQEGIIYTRAEYPLAIATLRNAIELAYQENYLGKNICGKKGFHFDLTIQQGAGAFVCGEETALIASIEGKRGNPRPRPPYPATEGLYGKPTIVNNVGTWGHIATIFEHGYKEYVKVGSKFSKGTKILCLSGDVVRTGVIEVPFGITLKEIIFDVGGGVTPGTKFKAAFTGGPAGGCVVQKDLGATLDYESMTRLHTIMGSGSFIVANNTTCMVSMTKFFLSFTAEESCGKCVPCREGTKRLLEMLTNVSRGVGKVGDIDKIYDLAVTVSRTSLCGLGQAAPNPVISAITHFRKEFEAHLVDKTCPAHVCENLLKYEVIPDKCTGCTSCAHHCPVHCISGELKKVHLIDQSACIKCGKCYEVCAFDAIKRA